MRVQESEHREALNQLHAQLLWGAERHWCDKCAMSGGRVRQDLFLYASGETDDL